MTEATGTATETAEKASRKPDWKEDPEQYRMTIGEHLEELRWRLILALVGLFVVLIVCLFFGSQVMSTFCAPLINGLKGYNLDPRLYYRELGEGFMVYLRVSLISAAAIAAPWMLYQIWMFVAAGLYPNERRAVLRYLPFSIVLLISGMLFMYFLVLPWTVKFFIGFASDVRIPMSTSALVDKAPENPFIIPEVEGDLKNPRDREMWINSHEGRIKISFQGQVRSIPFGPENLLAPQITLSEYINLVLVLLVLFGLAFQLPLVVMALLRIGIVEPETLRRSRRIVYFVLLIVSASITPGDMVTATVALMLPLIILYEMGIVLGSRGLKQAQEAEESDAGA